MRLGIAGVEVVDDDGDGLRRVAGRLQRLQADASEFDGVVITKRRECVARFCRRAEIDGRARAIAQLQMAGDEIGMQMGQEDVPDGERVFGGEFHVLIDVPLRIDNGCRARRFVSNQVGGVRQARQIELLEDHTLPSLSSYSFASETIRI